jgi:hypothetical protein
MVYGGQILLIILTVDKVGQVGAVQAQSELLGQPFLSVGLDFLLVISARELQQEPDGLGQAADVPVGDGDGHFVVVVEERIKRERG